MTGTQHYLSCKDVWFSVGWEKERSDTPIKKRVQDTDGYVALLLYPSCGHGRNPATYMKFSPDYLLQQLRRHPDTSCYQVAFSGGLDSHALLHALCKLRAVLDAEIGAVHIHHGLQQDADVWELQCQQVCAGLEVPYVSLRVDAKALRGESPEAAARSARYAALADWLPAGHCLLTAQHQDDQAETLLLQLLRGSGVSGLAAMPVLASLGGGRHLRPLLAVTREALHQYAIANKLTWIEDPSNSDTAFDRNYLRQQVLPVLRERWPAVASSLSRSASHCADAAHLLADLAEQDLRALSSREDSLSLTGLAALPCARQSNVLRHWIKQLSGRTPSTAVLARILHDMPGSRRDSGPCVRWGNFEIRRYREELFLLRQTGSGDQSAALDWALAGPLVLPGAGGVLTAIPETGCGIRVAAVPDGRVRVAWRQGGECCMPAGRGHHHSLKKLFQERGIPPWERSRIPLIYIQDRLAAVAGLWICEPFQAGPAESGFRINWLPGR
jgi:tRNA(Ile)-lysidine synthase